MERGKLVYFVRHGQSVDNISPVFQSEDTPLSENGIRQAKFIADRVSHLQFDALIASPLRRTKQTSAAISEATGMAVEYSDLFVERIKPASISGKPFTDKKASDIWFRWDKSFYESGEGLKGAENYSRILNRADKALEFLLNRKENTLLVVTHGYFLRVMLTRVLLGDNLKPELFESIIKTMDMENTGLTVLKYAKAFDQDYKWRLWIHNDHAHLAE